MFCGRFSPQAGAIRGCTGAERPRMGPILPGKPDPRMKSAKNASNSGSRFRHSCHLPSRTMRSTSSLSSKATRCNAHPRHLRLRRRFAWFVAIPSAIAASFASSTIARASGAGAGDVSTHTTRCCNFAIDAFVYFHSTSLCLAWDIH